MTSQTRRPCAFPHCCTDTTVDSESFVAFFFSLTIITISTFVERSVRSVVGINNASLHSALFKKTTACFVVVLLIIIVYLFVCFYPSLTFLHTSKWLKAGTNFTSLSSRFGYLTCGLHSHVFVIAGLRSLPWRLWGVQIVRPLGWACLACVC